MNVVAFIRPQAIEEERPGGHQFPESHRTQRKVESRPKTGGAAEAGVTGRGDRAFQVPEETQAYGKPGAEAMLSLV